MEEVAPGGRLDPGSDLPAAICSTRLCVFLPALSVCVAQIMQIIYFKINHRPSVCIFITEQRAERVCNHLVMVKD